MAILDLFSKQRKRERGEVPDVFVYDRIPDALRVQVVHILRDALGDSRRDYSPAYNSYVEIVNALCRERGVFKLAAGSQPEEVLANFLLREQNVEQFLNGIQVSFRHVEQVGSNYNYRTRAGPSMTPDEAIEELNGRFMEHGVGYQYVFGGRIVRKDSELLHTEVVKPALALLQDPRYQGTNDEFLKAHEHYRKGEVKDCLVYSLKALESTLKTICSIRRWPFQPTDTAKALFDICFQQGLVPTFLESHYSALKSTLESGVPTLRNKLGGHGQGTQVVTVPPHYAAYMLHMTGSAICFLIEAEKALP